MKMMKRNFAHGAPVLVAACCGAAAGLTPARAAQPAEDQVQLEEVIVTAEKRSERLQEVPAAVSALSGDTLQAMGAQQFTDYARSIPGLTFTDAGAGRQAPSIRGLNPTAGSGTVGYYIDETPIPGIQGTGYSISISPSLVDIDRVEVLRGPQGTLYGSSSIGGTIKLIPNAPNLSRVEGSVRAEASVTQGNDGASPGYRAQLVVNAPILENRLAVRAAFWYDDIGGYITRTWTDAGMLGLPSGPIVGKVKNLPDEHTWGMRTTALFEPTEQLQISAMAFLERQHFDGFNDITGGTGNPNDSLVQNFLANTPEPQSNAFDLYNVTVKYDFGRFNLVSSSSYLQRVQQTSEEATSLVQYIPVFFGAAAFNGILANTGYYNQSVYSVSQEARLATTERIAGFDAVLGVFWSQAHEPSNYSYYPSGYDALVAGNDPTNPAYAPDGGNVYHAYGPTFQERQAAGFGELTWHATDALSLTGGMRHYNVSNRALLYASGLLIGGNVPGFLSVTDNSSRAQGNVYKGNVSYQLTPDHLLYAQYSEGFRPGFGRSPLPTECASDATGGQVRPDSIRSYEIGTKTGWLDKRLTVNISAYRINWSDIQELRLLPCGFGTSDNFGNAVIKGGELETAAQLTRRITAGLSLTYLNTKLEDASPLSGAQIGDPIQYVPNWQYALYAQTSLPFRQSDDGYARLDYQYTGSSITDYSRLTDGLFDPAHEVRVVRQLNARLGEHFSAWDFDLSAMNLLNRTVRQSLDPNASITIAIPGRPRYIMTRPRSFALGATYHF
jgi:outer membrane receptor protein involved in Fe transport